MAGIGRPKGQKGHNPVKHSAVVQFARWRAEGEALIISAERAYEISAGIVDVRGDRATIPLSAVALSLSVANHKK